MEQEKSKEGRWYECSFCKRGFTNAQALGGHMNIHRKEKDKAKAKAQKKILEPHPHIAPAAEYCFFPDNLPHHHIHSSRNLTHLQQQQQDDVDLELRLGRLL